MHDRLLDRTPVIRRDAWKPEVVVGRVHQHRGEATLAKPQIVRVVGGRLRIQTAREDHPGNLVLEQHLDVVRFRDPGRRASAEDRRETALGERVGHDLGECRKDRVLQLREHEPDESRTCPAQPGRTLVAEDVERRQHELLRRLRHSGPLIEHATHRRLAHARVLSHLGKPPPHRRQASARNRQT